MFSVVRWAVIRGQRISRVCWKKEPNAAWPWYQVSSSPHLAEVHGILCRPRSNLPLVWSFPNSASRILTNASHFPDQFTIHVNLGTLMDIHSTLSDAKFCTCVTILEPDKEIINKCWNV